MNTSVVTPESVDTERLLTLINTLRDELQDRDSLSIKLLASLDDQINEQKAINAKLLQQNDELLERLEAYTN